MQPVPMAIGHDDPEAYCGLIFTGGLYQYSWKTPKGKVGCFEFRLPLNDGSTRVALFRLR